MNVKGFEIPFRFWRKACVNLKFLEDAGNESELKIRLTWLSEGSLGIHMTMRDGGWLAAISDEEKRVFLRIASEAQGRCDADRHVYMVTVWGVGTVYVGEQRRKAEGAQDEWWLSLSEGHGRGYFPVDLWRDGELISSHGER